MTANENIFWGPLSPCGGGGPSLDELVALRREAGAATWRRVSDMAQVCASYLVCHPAVLAVRYPGLTSDAAYHEASCILEGGFGPLVDVCLLASGEWLRYDARLADATASARDEVLRLEHALASLGR